MIRREIVQKVKQIFINMSNNGYWLITGAAMVMHGIKTQTSDIDIGCTKEFFEELRNNGHAVIRKEGYPDRICIESCVEILEGIETKEIVYIEEIPVSSIKDIITFKKKLNREKDKKDLIQIENYLQHINIKKRRLFDVLYHSQKNVPYYRDKLEKIVQEDKVYEILPSLPIVNKKEYVENIDNFFVPQNEEVVWEFTSGSTGQPLKICKTKKERVIQGWMLQSLRRESGLEIGTSIIIRFHNFVNENNNTEILRKPIIVNNQIYFPTLFFDNDNIKELRDLLHPYDKTWIYGTPSQVYKMCCLLDNIDFSIEKIIYIELFGEVLFEYQKKKIQSIFACPIRNMYGCHEVWAIAYECSCGNLHVLENNVLVEIVDKNGKNIGYDQEGEIVLTSLIQKSLPFIRYKIGDRGKIKKSDCLCGLTSDILELSAARIADDIILEDGRRVSSIVFLHILMLINKERVTIKQFQIYQRSYKRFEVNIVPTYDINKECVESVFCQVLNETLQENIELKFVYLDDIKINSISGKIKYFFPFVV